MRTPIGQLLIDFDRIAFNVSLLQDFLPKGTEIMPVIKANGYGVGALSLGHFYQDLGLSFFAVAHVSEAKELRQGGIHVPILALQSHPDDFEEASKFDIHVSLHHNLAVLPSCPLSIHLPIDTGMCRMGLSPSEGLGVAEKIFQQPHLRLEGVYSHFSSASNPKEDPFTLSQNSLFTKFLDDLKKKGIVPPHRHLSNSAGALRFSLPFLNFVRPGLMLYGISPMTNPPFALKPALTLRSQIDGIHTLKKGDSVGYNRRYMAKEEGEKIAVVPLGYYDGIARTFGQGGLVMIHGQKVPVVGDVCMDALMVNVTSLSKVSIGDSVTFFGVDEEGRSFPIEEHAAKTRTIPYETLTRIGPRVVRTPRGAARVAPYLTLTQPLQLHN